MGDAPNYAAFALPIFAVAIFAEVMVARRRGRARELYSLGTAISDVGCGATFQALEVVLTLATLAVYAWLFEHARLVTWDEGSPWPWVIGIVGLDFLYYWWHRVSHVANVMWAVHGVHHQSEDYNLAVALRQPVLEPVTWLAFYWVLALLGVPPLVFVISYGSNLFYQFWIHTQLVGTLPRPIEWLLNTPSHHRVHHGVDSEYLDKNYAGVLIVWDRLFGTFQAERQAPTYGTTVPLRSYDPLWANAQHLQRTYTLCRRATRWSDKLWVWFAHPGWLPSGVEDPQSKPDRSRYQKYRPSLSRRTAWYVGLSLAIVVSAAAPFVYMGHLLPLPQILAAAAVLVLGYTSITAVIERKRWATAIDWARIVGLPLVVGWLMVSHVGWGAGLAVAAVVLIASATARLTLLTTPRDVVLSGHSSAR